MKASAEGTVFWWLIGNTEKAEGDTERPVLGS